MNSITTPMPPDGLDDFLAMSLDAVTPVVATAKTMAPSAPTVAPISAPAAAPNPLQFLESGQVPAFNFAELDAREVQQVMIVVPAEEVDGQFVVNGDAMAMLRAELQNWFQAMRDAGQMMTELISPAVREQSLRQMIRGLLETAYSMPTRSWTTALPTGQQIVIAPSSVVGAIGFEAICRVVHEQAIRSAQALGKPFNAGALSYYQNSHPMETH